MFDKSAIQQFLVLLFNCAFETLNGSNAV